MSTGADRPGIWVLNETGRKISVQVTNNSGGAPGASPVQATQLFAPTFAETFWNRPGSETITATVDGIQVILTEVESRSQVTFYTDCVVAIEPTTGVRFQTYS
ncbi:hypothetical protein M422DRAFT_246330 [Sphaerobolus stellatus SS14]|nr:hypothetical protein M422DRAFT_246330 [Sphaerobolus stellatus SS14]